MSDTTPSEPVPPEAEAVSVPTPPEAHAPLPQEPSTPDVLADVTHPIGSAYDPMPLQVSTAKDTNWMGVVALITGIIGLSVVAIVFGILGLSAAKKGKATNRGMSIAGIVLGAIWLVASAVIVGALLLLVDNATTLSSAKVGDCYESTVGTSDMQSDVNPVFGSCATGTNAEIYYITTYTGESLPSDAGFEDELFTLCMSQTAVAAIDGEVAADYYVEYYVSSPQNGDKDAHTVLCGLSTHGAPIDPDAVDESGA